MLTACQAIEFRKPIRSSALLQFTHAHLREHVSFAGEDRIFAEDIAVVADMISDFSFVERLAAFSHTRGMELNRGFLEFMPE